MQLDVGLKSFNGCVFSNDERNFPLVKRRATFLLIASLEAGVEKHLPFSKLGYKQQQEAKKPLQDGRIVLGEATEVKCVVKYRNCVCVCHLRWGVVAHKNNTLFVRIWTLLQATSAQMGAAAELVAGGPNNLQTQDGIRQNE